MVSWFGRKPGFEAFAEPIARRVLRSEMKAANLKMRAPQGFEGTIAERHPPMFGAEIADSQSLKSARKIFKKGRAGEAPSLKGGRK